MHDETLALHTGFDADRALRRNVRPVAR